jgi:hypothetical protein
MENFSHLETMDQIKQKLLSMDYEDLMELLAIYQCPVGKLAANIAKAKGLKDSQIEAGKKKGQINLDHIAICRIVYLADEDHKEKLRSNQVIEGVLKDICAGVEGIATALEKR